MDVLKTARKAVKSFQGESVRSVLESLTPGLFSVSKTVRHGFPYQPSALAVDGVQNLLAIGTDAGGIKFLGRAGVELYVDHPSGSRVTHLAFLVNEGALISVTADNSVHMWSLRQKIPTIVQSLNFQEKNCGTSHSTGRISCCYVPTRSKWLYVGSQDGNVYTVDISTFNVSFYVIYWNHVNDTMRPGAVQFLLENPDDNNRMLLVYEKTVVMWDLRSKVVLFRDKCDKAPIGVSWLSDGKQYAIATVDGGINICNAKDGGRVRTIVDPATLKPHEINPAYHLRWLSTKDVSMFIHAGGSDSHMAKRCVTLRRGEEVKCLEFQSNVVGLACLTNSPHGNDTQDPHTLIVLCENSLEVVDLSFPALPRFELPFATAIHGSPVTCIKYEADVPPDLLESLESAGHAQRPVIPLSRRTWPINGGSLSPFTTDFCDLIITGHADGSVRFWDASQVVLSSIYCLQTAPLFEGQSVATTPPLQREKEPSSTETCESDKKNSKTQQPLAIETISLCGESKTLVLGNRASVVLFCKFADKDGDTGIKDLRVSPTTMDLTVRRCNSANMIFEGGSEDRKQPLKRASGGSPDSAAASAGTNPLPWLQCRRGKVLQHRGIIAVLCLTCSLPGEEVPANVIEFCASLNLLAVTVASTMLLVDVAQEKLIINKPVALVSESVNQAVMDRKRSGTVGGSPVTSRGAKMRMPTVRRHHKTSAHNLLADGAGSTSPGTYKKRVSMFSKRKPSSPDMPNSEEASSIAEDGHASSLAPTPTSDGGGGMAFKGKALLAHVKKKTSQMRLDNADGGAAAAAAAGGTTPVSGDEKELSGVNEEHAPAAVCAEEADSPESVQCIQFAITYSIKDDYHLHPSIWLGTSSGNVISLTIAMPPTPESRSIQDISWEAKAVILRVSSKAPVVTLKQLDENGRIPHLTDTPYVDPRARVKSTSSPAAVDTLAVKNSYTRLNSDPAGAQTPGHFLLAATEHNAYVYALPTHGRRKCSIRDGTVALQSAVTSFGEGAALCALTADGHSVIIGLPNLTRLLDVDLCPPQVPTRLADTMTWTTEGQALYMPSPFEIQRLSLLKENILNLPDSLPDLHTAKPFPEAPQKGLLAALLGSKKLDRDALFGAELRDGNQTVAVRVSGTGGLEAVRLKTGVALDEFSRAQEQLVKRGLNLARAEDATAKMASSAHGFAETARAVAQQMRERS